MLIRGCVLLKLSLINSFEVAGQALGLDRMTFGHMLHNFLNGMLIDETEIFEIVIVRCSVIEICWDVSAQLEVVGVMVFIKQVRHAFQLTGLTLSVSILVS